MLKPPQKPEWCEIHDRIRFHRSDTDLSSNWTRGHDWQQIPHCRRPSSWRRSPHRAGTHPIERHRRGTPDSRQWPSLPSPRRLLWSPFARDLSSRSMRMMTMSRRLELLWRTRRLPLVTGSTRGVWWGTRRCFAAGCPQCDRHRGLSSGRRRVSPCSSLVGLCWASRRCIGERHRWTEMAGWTHVLWIELRIYNTFVILV